jgi:L-alanine-DL-glutamate epimerase-like enolase superfamily enzyme
VVQMTAQASTFFNAHTWSSALNTAACLHLTASAPHYLVMELKPIPSPMQHELVKQPIEQLDGWIDIPEGPGLGVEVDEAVVRKYLFE